MLPNSIRWKIQAWHGFLLVAVVAGLIGGFYNYERRERLREIDNQLLELLPPLLPKLSPQRAGPGPGPRFDPPPGGRRPPPPEELDLPDGPPGRMPPPRNLEFNRPERTMPEFESGKFYYISWTPEQTILLRSTNAPENLPCPAREEFTEDHALRTRGNARELLHFRPQGSALLVGTSTVPMQQQLRRLGVGLTTAGLAVVTLGLAGGWFMAGRAIRPIAEISASAETIAAGDLSRRINVAETEGELGQLAAVLNRTFDKLEKSFEQQVRFTADASHELRTPLSVVLTQIQLALARDRSPAEYQQTLQTCERAAERMRALVNSLLELSRVDSGEFELMLESCDLSRVARESLEFIQPLALQRKVRLEQRLEPIQIRADAMKLGQVFINLLTNAIQHNAEGISVCLSVFEKNGRAIISVRDSGAGLPAEAKEHLFERFFQLDKSRAHKGGSGLGLAISKAIVEAHGGNIRAESEPGGGTEFIIELPM